MCSLAVQMVYSLATVLIHPLAGGWFRAGHFGGFHPAHTPDHRTGHSPATALTHLFAVGWFKAGRFRDFHRVHMPSHLILRR